MGLSSLCLRPLSPAVQGSAYLLTHRSWTSRIGTGFRKWSFWRPRRLVTTRPASSSCLRCFIPPKRVIEKSSSSRLRRVGSARALNTASMPRTIGDVLVTCQAAAGFPERPDNFKALNDAFGHAAGDEVLRRIGRFLGAAVRGEDIACRFGGEEFVVILPKA